MGTYLCWWPGCWHHRTVRLLIALRGPVLPTDRTVGYRRPNPSDRSHGPDPGVTYMSRRRRPPLQLPVAGGMSSGSYCWPSSRRTFPLNWKRNGCLSLSYRLEERVVYLYVSAIEAIGWGIDGYRLLANPDWMGSLEGALTGVGVEWTVACSAARLWFLSFSSRLHFARLLLNQTCIIWSYAWRLTHNWHCIDLEPNLTPS